MPTGTARKVIELGPDGDVSGDGFHVRISGSRLVVEDYWMPTWFEITVGGDDGEPVTFARVEAREDGPTLVDLRLTSPDIETRGIKQADLRSIEVRALVEDLTAGFTIRIKGHWRHEIEAVVPVPDSVDYADAVRRIVRMRSGKGTREITPKLLERVADIYRANIDSAPTAAVRKAYQVSPRMAAEYVSRARKRGLLPPTKQGKKRA